MSAIAGKAVDIVSGPAFEAVRPCAAIEIVRPAQALQQVFPAQPDHDIVSAIADQRIVTIGGPAGQRQQIRIAQRAAIVEQDGGDGKGTEIVSSDPHAVFGAGNSQNQLAAIVGRAQHVCRDTRAEQQAICSGWVDDDILSIAKIEQVIVVARATFEQVVTGAAGEYLVENGTG